MKGSPVRVRASALVVCRAFLSRYRRAPCREDQTGTASARFRSEVRATRGPTSAVEVRSVAAAPGSFRRLLVAGERRAAPGAAQGRQRRVAGALAPEWP